MENSESYNSFLILAQRILELEHNIKLELNSFIKEKRRKVVFDLMNNEEGYFIEVEPLQKNIDITKIANKIYDQNRVIALNPKAFLIRQIIVFQNKLSNDQRTQLEDNLQTLISNALLIVYDIVDLKKMALKHKVNFDEISYFELFENEHTVDSINYIFKNKQIFFVEEDWQNDQNFNVGDDFNSIKKGDIIFIKHHTTSNGISFLIIEGFGVVTQNSKNVKTLQANWAIFNKNVKIEGAEYYSKNLQIVKQIDRNLILKHVLNKFPDFEARLKEVASMVNPFETGEIEVSIDRHSKFLIGKNVGAEIKNYGVIFLPKSSHGGIGQNGIAAHVLNLLGKDRNEIQFTSSELKELKYKWETVYVGNKSIEVCFIVSKDIDKNSLDFTENLKNAIYNYSPALGSINPPSEETKIFIPLLGTGQAQLPVADSFNFINEILPLFKDYFKNPQIRINFPLEIERDELLNYANVLVTFHKLDEIDNLRQEINRLFDNEDDQLPLNNIDPTKDKIPFHLDNVETIDKLNREPVAKSLARLINAEIFDNKKMNYSFMVHLQGEWGSGKSTFLNLVKQNLDTQKRKWVVINYNAWQNQHISPPWWSFIDQIYRQAVKKPNNLNWLQKRYIIAKEKFRRIIKYSSAYKALTFSIAVLLILILFNYKTEIAAILKNLFSSDFTQETKGILTAEELKDLLLTVSAIVGVIILLAKFFSTPLLMQSSKEAISFMHRAADPMNKIKEHFNSLIGDINNMKFDVAVFIDDIDRCNRKYTVELLEGIQTLFKEKKVLYIVAGDKSWITSCFENNYDEFSKNLTSKGENLGDLFLEKAFQLSIRMPEVSEKSKESFWKDIIGAKDESTDAEKTKLTQAQRTEIKKIVVDNYNNNENNSTTLNNLESEYNISSEEASDLAIEALDENVEDVRHLLLSFHKSLNPNPRSIKRLANYYTMYRNTLIAEKADFLPTKLFRWLLLEDKYPILVRQFLKDGEIDKVDEFMKDQHYSSRQKDDLMELLDGSAENNEEPLRMEELIKILKK